MSTSHLVAYCQWALFFFKIHFLNFGIEFAQFIFYSFQLKEKKKEDRSIVNVRVYTYNKATNNITMPTVIRVIE